ncbi:MULTISPECIES: fumarylacetoacetate hydrolase family protein [Paenibacillus]|uniref:fumarylacetoacetate hydrolase family protein n=1 Tax=Paenibacillus TaxID=44249 RepID=UPI00096FAB70|nr:fumarylacetoacetate hydrolase family protein [Paenibacillus sp. FSL H8-0259]OMF25088.1 5-carboxymethyl-2-hydroxymuconate isomerase [Paenibacillus sp. FSL H8-0259]
MKLLSYIQEGVTRVGVHTEAGILDVEHALTASGYLKGTSSVTLQNVIAGGLEMLSHLNGLAGQAVSGTVPESDAVVLLDESTLQLAPCVPRPGKIICVGLNYRKHAEETNAPIPQTPILFSKFNNALAAHLEPVPLPAASQTVDYEAELVIVMGRTARNVSREEAYKYVYGYCCGNDLSARDLQMRTQQWLLGKTCDKFAPVGPYLVTADEVGDPNQLAISCTVNGELRQSSNTADMIFKCDEIISYISQHFTLEPGDMIMTGTPEGVMLGYPPEQQVYLQAGDTITVEIEKLGRLTNTMTI